MTALDTLRAYEAGLITEAEAMEQALVDKIDDLHTSATFVTGPRPEMRIGHAAIAGRPGR